MSNENVIEFIKSEMPTIYGHSTVDIFEFLDSHKPIIEGEPDHHRWYYTYDVVVKVGDRHICYVKARATGDNSASDLGFEDDINDIHFCQLTEKVVLDYQIVGK